MNKNEIKLGDFVIYKTDNVPNLERYCCAEIVDIKGEEKITGLAVIKNGEKTWIDPDQIKDVVHGE